MDSATSKRVNLRLSIVVNIKMTKNAAMAKLTTKTDLFTLEIFRTTIGTDTDN